MKSRIIRESRVDPFVGDYDLNDIVDKALKDVEKVKMGDEIKITIEYIENEYSCS